VNSGAREGQVVSAPHVAHIVLLVLQEEFEDTNGVIRITIFKYDMTIEYSVNSCNMQNKAAYRNLTDNSLLVSTVDLYVQ
jgi:hypothetical protein